MILSTRKCGCRDEESQASRTTFANSNASNLNSCSSQSFIDSDCLSESDGDLCGCESSEDEEPPPRVYSEIEAKGQPYKEIEAIFNNNRMVVRIQKEKPKPEFDPPCDCIEPLEGEDYSPEQGGTGMGQEGGEGCRTINVYPHPDPKKKFTSRTVLDKFGRDDAKKGAVKQPVKLPTVNPEENPNIFVLKIKRKCDDGDKKHNLDLEFRTPRPWRNNSPKK